MILELLSGSHDSALRYVFDTWAKGEGVERTKVSRRLGGSHRLKTGRADDMR